MRSWLAKDLGLGVASAVVLGFWAQQIADSWGPGYWPFDCAAGVVVCALALVRRRGRLRAAVAGLAVAAVAILVARLTGLPAEPGPGLAIGLSVLVGSAVRVLPVRQAAGVAAGGLAVVAASSFSGSTHMSVVVLNGAAWLAALAAGLGSRLLAGRRMAAAERVRRQERLRLARELHDVVAHHVTSVVLQAQAAQLVARKDPGRVGESLVDIEAAGAEALAATRRVVGLLREPTPFERAEEPGPVRSGGESGLVRPGGEPGSVRSGGESAPVRPGGEPGPLRPGGESGPVRAGGEPGLFRPGDEPGALRSAGQLGELVARFNGPPVRLRLPEGEPGWPPEVAGTVYRVVQEALTNVSRHAPTAASVTVTVTQREGGLVVEVTNDAPPSPSSRARWSGGYGLIGMRERVEALGGELSAGPRPEGGWSVQATLPLRDQRT